MLHSSSHVRRFGVLGLLLVAAIGCGKEVRLPSSSTEASLHLSLYQMITGDDSDEERERWNSRYHKSPRLEREEADLFLQKNVQTLPRGKALVLAMGEGADAIFLAKQGYRVTGIDFSDEAIRRAKR